MAQPHTIDKLRMSTPRKIVLLNSKDTTMKLRRWGIVGSGNSFFVLKFNFDTSLSWKHAKIDKIVSSRGNA